MDVALTRPTIYMSTSGLWSTVSLVVFGVVPPPSGQASPTHDHLHTITVATPQPVTIHLPVQGGKFRHVAITFAVTTGPADVGTARVSIMRDEDPLQGNGTRPVHKVVELTRSTTSSPTFIVKTFALVGT
jgi:hypothetical protein